MATETQETKAAPVIEVVEDTDDLDQVLEAKFGAKQVPAHVKSFEQIQDEAGMTMKRFAPEDDDKLSPEAWLKKYMEKVAARSFKVKLWADEWMPVFRLDVNGMAGSFGYHQIEALRRTRDLEQIERGMRGFMSGFFKDLRE